MRRIGLAVATVALALVTSAPPASAAVEYLRSFGQGSLGTTLINEGVAVDAAGNVYAASNNADRVFRFSPTGALLGAIGTQGSSPGQFLHPSGVAISPADGNVYVTDSFRQKVVIFTPQGQFVTEWGQAGTAAGQFAPDEAYGIAFDHTGNVVIAGFSQNRVQRFSPTGTFLGAIGTTGSGIGQFDQPFFLEVGLNGQTYVADVGNDRIVRLDTGPGWLGTFGQAGSGTGQLSMPVGIAVAPDGSLYVADDNRARVLHYSQEGGFLDEFGAGPGPGQLADIWDVAVDCRGNVFVQEKSGERIVEFGDPAKAPPPCVAPDAVTLAPQEVTTSSAKVTGTVDPRGDASTYHFEYGSTTAYGTSTASASAGAGSGAAPVSATLSGLAPGTPYHYRLVASNAFGADNGEDQVLTTQVMPVTTVTTTTPTPAPSPAPVTTTVTTPAPVTPAPPRCRVPKVIGLSLAAARKKLLKARCAVGKVRRSKGALVVRTQSRRVGTTVAAGTKVNLTLARKRR